MPWFPAWISLTILYSRLFCNNIICIHPLLSLLHGQPGWDFWYSHCHSVQQNAQQMVLTGFRLWSQALRPLVDKLRPYVHNFTILTPQQACSGANESWIQTVSLGTFGHQRNSQKPYPLIVQSHVIETAIDPGPFY